MPRRRYEISDENGERIRDLLPGKASDPDRTAKDNRLFINAVLWIARTGPPGWIIGDPLICRNISARKPASYDSRTPDSYG